MRDMKVKAIHKAKLFAFQAHGWQQYGREPYFVHLQSVVDTTIRLGGDDIAEQVAWLHDVVEDTAVTVEDVLVQFGVVVAVAVQLLSKKEGEVYENYIASIRRNPIAKLVKIADTLSNLTQSTLQMNHKRIMKYTKQLQILTEV